MQVTAKQTVVRRPALGQQSGVQQRAAVVLVLLAPVTIALVPVLAFYFAGLLPGDAAYQYLPYKAVALEAYRQGELPLWNPYQFGGAPLLADPQNSLLYPAHVLFLILPLHLALAVDQLLHVLLLAVGSYLLLRLYCGRMPALAGALAFALSGQVFYKLNTGIYSIIQVIAWLPWLFYCLERFRLGGSRLWMVVGGSVLALQVLAGFPTLNFYTVLCVGIACLAALATAVRRGQWRAAGRLASGWCMLLVLGMLLAAVQLLPTAEFIANSSRSTPPYSFVRQGSLPPTNVITTVLPDLFGSATTHTAIQGAAWGEHNIYVGGLPVILALLGLLFARRGSPGALFSYALLAAVSLGIAFGAHNPLYALLYRYVPGFGQLADPGRMTILYSFFMSIVAALSIELLARELPRAGRRARRVFVAVAAITATGLLIALLVLMLGQDRLAGVAEPLIRSRYGDGAGEKLDKLGQLFMTQALTIAVFLGVVVLGGGAVYLRMRGSIGRRAFTAACLTIVVLDSGLFALRLAATMRPFDTVAEPAYVAAFDGVPEPYRVLSHDSSSFVNHGSRFGIPAIAGYNPLILSYYLDLLGVVRGAPVDPADRVPAVEVLDAPLLDLLNVRYVVSAQPLSEPDLQPVHHGDAYVYRRDGASPHYAWVVPRAERLADDAAAARLDDPAFDPAQTVLLAAGEAEHASARQAGSNAVTVLEQRHTSLALDVTTEAGGWLVLSEVYYPGWKAFVDGRETPVLRANLALRAIELQPGRHEVRFAYRPASFGYGMALSGLGLVAATVGSASAIRRRSRSSISIGRSVPQNGTDRRGIA